jgi:hypothetical protein
LHRSLRLRSGQALRRESPASRATPLPQDDNKAAVLRQGLSPAFPIKANVGINVKVKGGGQSLPWAKPKGVSVPHMPLRAIIRVHPVRIIAQAILILIW